MTTGKAKNDFPGGYIPFDKPVGPVPTVPIDSAPTVQLCINENWLPYVVTCLKALARPETWDDTYDKAVIAASEFAALIGDIKDGCGASVPSKMCVSGSFKDLDYGFVPQGGASCVSTWVSGTGWQGCCDSTPQAFLDIKREFGLTTLIRAVSLTFKVTIPYLVNYTVELKHGGTFTIIASDTGVTGPTIVVDVTGLSEPAESLWISIIEPLGGCGADPVVEDFSLCYTGDFPLSVPPDTFSHTFDFTLSDGGWAGQPCASCGTAPLATYASGVGWQGVASNFNPSQWFFAANIVKSFSSLRLTQVEVTYDATDGPYDLGNIADAIRLYVGTTDTSDQLSPAPGPNGTDLTLTWTGDVVVDNILISIWKAWSSGSSMGSAAALIKKVTIRGFGADPF